jgi:hypothetical protein
MRQCVATYLLVLVCASCTRPAPDPPGIGEQPEQHPERSLATQPTRPGPAGSTPPSQSPDNPDQLGTTRTPPAAAAAPMDDEDDGGATHQAREAGVRR